MISVLLSYQLTVTVRPSTRGLQALKTKLFSSILFFFGDRRAGPAEAGCASQGRA
jgi:hypothetical protein